MRCASMPDRIVVEGIQVYGHHGTTEHEQAVGGRYTIDVELEVDLRPAGDADRLEATVNYADVASLVHSIGCQTRYHLLEGLAQRISMELLNRFPADRVIVRVGKDSPPLGVSIKRAGVTIERTRSDLAR
jgi:dihydroneopterin aldolase